MPDRYATAVRARRAELRGRRDRLAGGPREELRRALALSRLATAAEITAALDRLSAELAAHLARADRADRRRFPARLAHAVDDTAHRLYLGWAARLRPALLRIATAHALPVRPGWPNLPAAGPLPAARAPRPDGWLRCLASGAAHGAALWRPVLVPLALLPVFWGLPALGGRALVPLAAGSGIAAVAVAARARWVAAERARLHRHADRVLVMAGRALEADLGRRLLEIDAGAGSVLDAAVRTRRAEIEAELALLAPDRARCGA